MKSCDIRYSVIRIIHILTSNFIGKNDSQGMGIWGVYSYLYNSNALLSGANVLRSSQHFIVH